MTALWRRGSLRLRILALVLLAALPGFLAAGLTAYHEAREAESAARTNLIRVTAHAQGDFADAVADAKAALGVIDSAVQHGPDACPVVARVIWKQNPDYLNAGIIDAGGQVACSLGPLAQGDWADDLTVIRRATRTTEAVVGEFRRDGLSTEPHVVIAQAVDRRPGGRWVSFTVLALHDLLNSENLRDLPPGAEVSVLDPRGHPVVKLENAAEIDAVTRALANGTTVPGLARIHAARFGKHLVVWSRADAATGGGTMLIRIERALLYRAAWNHLAQGMLLMAGGLLLVLVLASSAGRRMILLPIHALMDAARRLAQGDLRARVELSRDAGEIGRAVAAFNAMAAELQRHSEERERHMREIERLNRIYIILTAINGAILRITDAQVLMDEACRIAYEIGGFQLACIGEIDAEAGAIKAVSFAGRDDGPGTNFTLPLDPADPDAHGPEAIAVREHRTAVSNRFQRDPATARRHALAERLGIRSAAAFPLSFDAHGAQRVLALYAAEEDSFETEELQLLEQLAQDTALGLHKIATEQALAHASTHDAVTGLPNQALLEDRLDYAIARAHAPARSLAVIVLDVGFQRLTSQAGWQAGYDFLRQIGQAIGKLLGEGDLAGYLPGARFAIVLVDLTDLAGTQGRIQQLLDRIAAITTQAHPDSVLPNPRAGVSMFPADGDRAAALLDQAQAALMAARDAAAAPLQFFAPEINVALQENRKLERYLRDAIANGELSLHYQPIFETTTLALRGFEALARWISPDLGEIPPSRFVPLAENCGLIGPLGDRVLAGAARQAFDWQRDGASNLHIALNVSAWQLRDPGFPDRTGTLLSGLGTRLAGVRLAMEITESQLMSDIDSGAAFLARLKALDIALHLDDFGTGYSSLSYLHRLPIDALKIDRSFIEQLDSSPQSRTIVQSIVALAAALDLTTIAEGIERQDQLDVIRRLGCRYAQGFLLGRPMTPAAAERLWHHSAPH